MARVQVNDKTWAYRGALGSIPVSVALGRLVEREWQATVDGQRLTQMAYAAPSRMLAPVAAQLAGLVARLEEVHGSALVPHPANDRRRTARRCSDRDAGQATLAAKSNTVL
jgi:hypothetical protein